MRRCACEEGIKGSERAGPERNGGERRKLAVKGAGEVQRARSRVT